jgi:hypothetical protein
MRIVLPSLILGLLGPFIAGCSCSTTVSEYAGMPRYLLPKDHVDYQPLHPAVARASNKPEKPAGALSLDESFAEEDARLRKVTKICRDCMSIVGARPPIAAPKLAAHEAPIVLPAAKLKQATEIDDE